MTSGKTEILVVEDNPGDARLIREALKETFTTPFEMNVRESLDSALNYLAAKSPAIVLLDLSLSDAQGLEGVRMIRAAAPAVPLVVLTGLDDEGLAVQAVREGAQDYLVKGQAEAALLSRALRHAMQRHRLQTTLQNLSVMDELTGLHNRRGFLNLAEQHLKLARRTRKPFSLAFIDLDGLKEVNDTLGHVEGDRALVETASLLRVCLRESDILGRLGGDEFVLLLATATENSQDGVRRRLQEQLDSCNAEPGRRYKLSFSVGIVAVAPEQQLSIEELVSQADALMYQEKKGKQGRPRSVRVAERTEK